MWNPIWHQGYGSSIVCYIVVWHSAAGNRWPEMQVPNLSACELMEAEKWWHAPEMSMGLCAKACDLPDGEGAHEWCAYLSECDHLSFRTGEHTPSSQMWQRPRLTKWAVGRTLVCLSEVPLACANTMRRVYVRALPAAINDDITMNP